MTARSDFRNADHEVVRLHFHTSGEENMRLFRGDSNSLSGPDGTQFTYAWKDRDETITEQEFSQYRATGTYGDNFVFGNLDGYVP
jgi:hypothetical protein